MAGHAVVGRRSYASLLGVSLALVLASAECTAPAPSASRSSPGPSSEAAAIEEVLREGLDARMKASVVTVAGSSAALASDADLRARADVLRLILSPYFTGDFLDLVASDRWADIATLIAAGQRDVDAGANQVTLTTVTIDGTSASGAVHAYLWRTYVPYDSARASGGSRDGWFDYNFKVVRVSDAWLISDYYEPRPTSSP